MRTASPADQDLVRRVAESGYPVSVAQLERWRQRGLLPRPDVRHLGRGRGTRVVSYSEQVVEAAALLAEHARPRRPWQRIGVMLFAHGFPLREDALRACALYLGEQVQRLMRAAWTRASLAPESRGSETDRLEDLAFLAAEIFVQQRAGRRAFLSYERLTRQALPAVPKSDVASVATYSLAMRIADAVGAGPLTADQLRSARYFSDRARSEIVRQPLMSERQACAATLTAREASLYRDLILISENELDEHQALLDLVVWSVAMDRLEVEEGPGRPPRADRPLPTSHLDDVEAAVAEALAEDVD